MDPILEEGYGEEAHRQSVMVVQRDNIIETLKHQCFERIKSKRRTILENRRKDLINATQSKQKMLNQSVNVSIVQDTDMLDEVIRKEIMKIHNSGDVEQWNQEYDQIIAELNTFLVQQLLDETKWNEELCYEREQQFCDMATEQMAMSHSSESKGTFSVCALCKMGFAYKFIKKGSGNRVRLACQN